MKQLLIIPDINNLQESLSLAEKYSLGFEYNDFYNPAVLDDGNRLNQIIETYSQNLLPEYCTIHGAFFDVIPFSVDSRIREISVLRIEQSIEAAKKVGALGVVFHTNYNPFLNTEAYIESWIKQNVVCWSEILERHKDISIYLENMFDTTPDIMVKLSEQLCSYSNYGVCLDYAHASISKVNPEIWSQKLGKYVKHIHINDNDLVSDLHLAWGNGKIDRAGFYKSYESYMRDAAVLIETTSIENQIQSLKVLSDEGFLD